MLASDISLGCSLELKPIDPPLSSLRIYTETSTTIASRPLPSWPGEFRKWPRGSMGSSSPTTAAAEIKAHPALTLLITLTRAREVYPNSQSSKRATAKSGRFKVRGTTAPRKFAPCKVLYVRRRRNDSISTSMPRDGTQPENRSPSSTTLIQVIHGDLTFL